MHRRHSHANIPIEAIRTLEAIIDYGSFTKAGDKLGLSQPAVSAQVKRLQQLIGGALFEKGPGGVAPTALGRLAYSQAKRLLAANDQILALGGSADVSRRIRLGVSTTHVERFISIIGRAERNDTLSTVAADSNELVRGLVEGWLDVCCVLNPSDDLGTVVRSWKEDFVWVRSRNFTVSPGAPIPVVCRPGGVADNSFVRTLEQADLSYRVAFAGGDYHARMLAVAEGIGIMGMPARFVTEPLVEAREHYLPTLPAVQFGIVVRNGVSKSKVRHAIELLLQLAPQPKASVSSESISAKDYGTLTAH